jgi:outer membrane protein OmpU
MNKFTKIGVSALAGSLAMFSANAGELSVSGAASASFNTESGDGAAAPGFDTGNPMGMDTRLTFSGSGELDNGMTTSFYVTDEINSSAGNSAFYSGEVALGMGDLGTISLNQGGGNVGADAIDDETPRAYEEADDQLRTNFRGLANPQGSGNLIKYTNSLGMVNVNLGFRSGSGSNNAVGQNGGTNAGNVYTGALTSSPIDGLTVGAGYSQVEADSGKDDEGYATFIKYAFGPVTVGAQRNITTSANSTPSATATSAAEGNQMSIAFNVNENLAVSYTDGEIDHFGVGATADVEEDYNSVNVSYTSGGMTLAAQRAEADNSDGNINSDEEKTEIVLSLAF